MWHHQESHFCESSTTSAHISPLDLRDMRRPSEQMIMLTKCPPTALWTPKKDSSSFNRTHCFLMVGNRDKREEGHTWALSRYVSIHQLPAQDVLICAFALRGSEGRKRILRPPLASGTSSNHFIQIGLVPYPSPINGIYLLFEKSR